MGNEQLIVKIINNPADILYAAKNICKHSNGHYCNKTATHKRKWNICESHTGGDEGFLSES